MKLITLTFLISLSVLSHTTAHALEFTNESEVGIAIASGNTNSKNINAKQANSAQIDLYLAKFNARYLNAESNGVESARYLFGGLRLERELSSRFSLYLAQGFENDKFAGYDLRHSSDLGGKYFIYKEETYTWVTELGYRYTNEKRINGTHVFQNSIRTFTEAEKKFNASVSAKYFAEYLPNLKESKDYQFNTELSVSAALNSTFSIKTAYLLRFDNLPAPGTSTKTDRLFTTALVAKF